MQRFRSLKDIERETYRLRLEKELAGYKLEYFFRNARANWNVESIVQQSVGRWVSTLISRLIRKKSNS